MPQTRQHRQLVAGIIHHFNSTALPRNLKEPQQRNNDRIICKSRPDTANAGKARTQNIGSDIHTPVIKSAHHPFRQQGRAGKAANLLKMTQCGQFHAILDDGNGAIR